MKPEPMSTLNLTGEEFGTLTQVYDGVWVLATLQRINGTKWFPPINSRSFVFRLIDDGAPVLAVVGAVDEAKIAEVKALERATGTPVRYIISHSGRRHLYVKYWHSAFPDAQVFLCPARTPRTANGKALMKLDRVSTMDPVDPLPQFKGQLDAVLFQGLACMKDTKSPQEGGSDSLWTTIKIGVKTKAQMFDDPVDDLWLRHVASGTVIGGENLGWMYPKDAHGRAPMAVRQIVKPDAVYVITNGRRVADPAAVAASWERVLAWQANSLVSFHDSPGYARPDLQLRELHQAVDQVGQLEG